jgi:transcriptional regulator with PAS, ATPase and Fis domain
MTRGSDTAVRLAISLKATAPKAARDMALSEIDSALLRHGGNLTHTALYLGVGRSTLNRWIAENAKLQLAVKSARKHGPV